MSLASRLFQPSHRRGFAGPALDPIQGWHIDQVRGNIFVKEKVVPVGPRRVSTKAHPSSIIVIGGGAAGLAATDMLRREGFPEFVNKELIDVNSPDTIGL